MEHVIKIHARRTAFLDAAVAVLIGIVLLPMVWVQRARRRRELMSLLGQPDYLLKDVGLQRSDITREGLKRFWTP